MLLAGFALRPAGRQRLAAITAKDEAPKREVGVDILSRWRRCCALSARLYLFEGLKAHHALVLAFAQPSIPIRCFDTASIDSAG